MILTLEHKANDLGVPTGGSAPIEVRGISVAQIAARIARTNCAIGSASSGYAAVASEPA